MVVRQVTGPRLGRQSSIGTFDDSCYYYNYELMKYNMTSHSWQLLPSSFLNEKVGVVAVALNRYIYALGGYQYRYLNAEWPCGE